MNMKRITAILLALLLLLGGCADTDIQAETEGNANTESTSSGSANAESASSLWILTEDSTSYSVGFDASIGDIVSTPVEGMNTLTENIIEAFGEKYPDVEIHLEVLPSDTSEREIRLEAIRTQILAGEGPDVFLLPSYTQIAADILRSGEKKDEFLGDESHEFTFISENIPVVSLEPLFSDVTLTMKSGIFADLTQLYAEDPGPDAELRLESVMDAGVYDGCRYVLPLYFNMPVICCNVDLCEEYGLDTQALAGNLDTLMDAALQTGDPYIAAFCLPEMLESGAEDDTLYENYGALLYSSTDYASETVHTDAQDLAGTMARYGKLKALSAGAEIVRGNITHVDDVVYHYLKGDDIQIPALTAWMSKSVCMYYAEVAMAQGQEVQILPLRAQDGSSVAVVTYYGAISASCSNVALAYEFLTQFLSADCQLSGFSVGSWPVCAVGSTEKIRGSYTSNLSRELQYISSTDSAMLERREQMLQQEFGDEIMPFSDIDRVLFWSPSWETGAAQFASLTGEETEEELYDVAESIVQQLQRAVSGG